MVKVSIVIPVFNNAQFLSKCLTSICEQTLSDIEIICINDCSSDGSLAILQEFAKNDNRIKLIDLKENKGVSVARNIGIKNSVGQYLGFVDSDDFIDLNFYEKLYEKALINDLEVVKGNIVIYCPKTKVTDKDSWVNLNDKVKLHKANFCYCFTSAIYKTSLIKEKKIEFLEGLIHFEDPYFTIKAALFYQKLEVVDDVCYYYVNNPNSTSRKKFTISHINSLLTGVDKILDMLDEYCIDKTHYIIVYNFLLEQLLYYCSNVTFSDDMSKKSVNGLLMLFGRCRYKEECLTHHFLNKKNSKREQIIKKLRNKVKNDYKNT